ncbi:MAG: biotin/lipoate A/B protein ligase family protein [Candidatus Bipolaricaulia bacterium]
MDTTKRIRVIKDLEIRPPSLNLGLEEAISKSVSEGKSPPTIRFWRNERSAIIGRSQEAEIELDLKNCKKSDIPVIRRPTGGGAVLHHPGNLNYSLYLPESSAGSVEEESKKMSGPVASALSELGPDVRIQTNGLFVDSLKIGGVAQSRRRGLLHHGTLLVKRDSFMKEMSSFLRAGRADYDKPVSRVASTPDPVGNIEDLEGAGVRLPNLVGIIITKFAETLGGRPDPGKIFEDEWKVASYLAKSKYSTTEWNFRYYEDAGGRELEALKRTGGSV